MKKVVMKLFLLTICILGFATVPGIYKADGENVRIDCDGGTFRQGKWMNTYDCGYMVDIGESLKENKCVLEDPTDIGRDFTGWNIYKQSDGSLLEKKLTTEQVLKYKIPCPVKIVAQYKNRKGTPVNGITYALIDNDTGEPVWDGKITIIHDGISYSGNGYVHISKEIYSKWKKKITYIVEAPGTYAKQNGKWCEMTKDVTTGNVADFKRHKSSYWLLSSTGKGKETEFPRSQINDIFYEASFVKPNISKVEEVNADTMISDASELPKDATIEKKVYESGKTYDTALDTAQSKLNTSNILVVDLELKDKDGATIHQLTKTVQVRLDIPSDYTIQAGNTVVVYYLEDDGTLTECATTYHEEDGSRYVLFETDHFSPYVMVEVPEKQEEPEDTETEKDTEVSESTESEKNSENTESTEEIEKTEAPESTETIDTPENTEDPTDGDTKGSMLPIIILVVVVVGIVAVALVFMRKK